MMDKAILYCNNCNEKWEQQIKEIGDIDWVCKVCGKTDDVFLQELIQKNKSDEPLVLGMGGCGKPSG